MRISDWSSDVFSSYLVDLHREFMVAQTFGYQHPHQREGVRRFHQLFLAMRITLQDFDARQPPRRIVVERPEHHFVAPARRDRAKQSLRSEEHTSELPSLMRISYAVSCLKTKHNKTNQST